MAIANQAPHIVAQRAKEADLVRKMNSVDPVERWNAKQKALNNGIAQLGRGMVQQAQRNAEKLRRDDKEYNRRNPWTR